MKLQQSRIILIFIFVFFFFFFFFFFSLIVLDVQATQTTQIKQSSADTKKIILGLADDFYLIRPIDPVSFQTYDLLEKLSYVTFCCKTTAWTDNIKFWQKKYLLLLQNLILYKDQLAIRNLLTSVGKSNKNYNLVVVLYDFVSSKKDYNSYGKVYVNRELLGQTNQALLSQKKILKGKVKEGVRHMLTVEKYFLNAFRRKWERMKNLLQPKVRYFQIPQDEIRVIEIIYDASKENSKMAHLKYQYRTYLIGNLSKVFQE